MSCLNLIMLIRFAKSVFIRRGPQRLHPLSYFSTRLSQEVVQAKIVEGNAI